MRAGELSSTYKEVRLDFLRKDTKLRDSISGAEAVFEKNQLIARVPVKYKTVKTRSPSWYDLFSVKIFDASDEELASMDFPVFEMQSNYDSRCCAKVVEEKYFEEANAFRSAVRQLWIDSQIEKVKSSLRNIVSSDLPKDLEGTHIDSFEIEEIENNDPLLVKFFYVDDGVVGEEPNLEVRFCGKSTDDLYNDANYNFTLNIEDSAQKIYGNFLEKVRNYVPADSVTESQTVAISV